MSEYEKYKFIDEVLKHTFFTQLYILTYQTKPYSQTELNRFIRQYHQINQDDNIQKFIEEVEILGFIFNQSKETVSRIGCKYITLYANLRLSEIDEKDLQYLTDEIIPKFRFKYGLDIGFVKTYNKNNLSSNDDIDCCLLISYKENID